MFWYGTGKNGDVKHKRRAWGKYGFRQPYIFEFQARVGWYGQRIQNGEKQGPKIYKKSLGIHCQYTANASHVSLGFQNVFQVYHRKHPEKLPFQHRIPSYNDPSFSSFSSLSGQFRRTGAPLSSAGGGGGGGGWWCYDPTLGSATQSFTSTFYINLPLATTCIDHDFLLRFGVLG